MPSPWDALPAVFQSDQFQSNRNYRGGAGNQLCHIIIITIMIAGQIIVNPGP